MEDWVLLSEENSSDHEEIVISSSMDQKKENSSDETELYPSDETEFYAFDEIRYSSDDQTDDFHFPTENFQSSLINKTLPHVLPHLPAKSLLRFKAVSPQFKTFICSPFIVLSHSICPKSISGLFYHQNDRPCYVSFDGSNGSDLPDPYLNFVPDIVTIKASTRGILCLRGLERYYVANPVTMEWAELPIHSRNHGDGVAVVILFDEPDVYNFSGDYQVVCAYQVFEGVYTFETFSSKSWEWAQSTLICDVERIVPASGVAVGAAAYWRTTMQNIVEYKPAPARDNNNDNEINGNIMNGDSLRTISHEIDPKFQYELGEMERKITIMSRTFFGGIKVDYMEEINGEVRWREERKISLTGLVDRERSTIFRSQGKAELLTWEALGEGKQLVLRNLEGTKLSSINGLEYCADFLPFIGTLVPIRRSTAIAAATEEASSSGSDALGKSQELKMQFKT